MKLSIITVTKNNKAGLLRAIESVRSQTYKNVEHIIVDGLSTDGTKEILKRVQDDTLRQAQDSLFTARYSLNKIILRFTFIQNPLTKRLTLLQQ